MSPIKLCKTISTSIILGLLISILLIGYINRKRACASVDSVPKNIIGSVLRHQDTFHSKKGVFFSSLSQFTELYPEIDHNYYATLDPSGKWSIQIETHNDYVIVRVTPKVSTFQNSLTKNVPETYIGATYYNLVQKNYYRFICSGSVSNPNLNIEINFKPDKTIEFNCPSGTQEDC